MSKLKSLFSFGLIVIMCGHAFATNDSHFKYGTNNTDNLINIDGRQFTMIDDMLILADEKNRKFDVNKAKWTDGKVFYEFAPDVTELNRQRFVDAYQVWESVADLEFIERTDQANYVYVQNDNRNYAIVGMVGGRQILSMTSWHSKFIIVHEIGHSLGMWHEHMRSDRDEYVTILEENIDPKQLYNFSQRQTSDYSEYDFLSIMHYTLSSYTTNGLPTIRPFAQYEEVAQYAGQREFISGGDQLEVATAYGAKQVSFTDSAFEAFLLANYDVNSDGVLDTLEATQITSLTTPGNGNISSLDGIEHFRYLEYLDVSNENLNSLPELPSRLKTIVARNNQFEVADFSWQTPPMISALDFAGNLFDVYDCDNLIALQNALQEGTVVFSPVADESALVCDESTRNMLVNGKAKEDLRSKGEQTFYIDVPANQTSLVIETVRFNDLDGGLMDMFVARDRVPTTTSFDNSSTNPGNNELVTIYNPEPGRWYITLSPTERSFENVSLTATYSEQVVDLGLLENGVTKTDLTAPKNGELDFYIDVPVDAKDLSIQITGGNGDADLYVRAGAEPTKTVYDCRPYRNGNAESCVFKSPSVTRYYIKLIGYQEFSGVSLSASYQIAEPVVGGSLTRDGLSDTQGSWQYFSIEIPEGMTSLNVVISGGRGDADLYVNSGSQPSTNRYQCRPYIAGNNETCEFSNPAAGTWYIGIRAYNSYTDLSLEANWE